MTLGVRDTRKIDAVYNMTETDVREQARFHDSIGIYPEFIDGYGILILPTTGRYMQLPYRNVLPKGVRNLLVPGRSSGGDRISHGNPQHGVLRSAGPGRRRGRSAVAALRARVGRRRHRRGAARVDPPRRPSPVASASLRRPVAPTPHPLSQSRDQTTGQAGAAAAQAAP